MIELLSAAQSRHADHFTIQNIGVPETLLMEHAALAAFQRLQLRFKGLLDRVPGLILAGPGNNGGDALAVARLLTLAGCKRISIYALSGQKSISYEIQKKMVEKLNVTFVNELPTSPIAFIVDGMFGTGLTRPLEGECKEIIEWVNQISERTWVVALDIPSGLNSDSGLPMPVAVKASETVTFGFMKKGLVTGLAADYTGPITLAPLQIPRSIPTVKAEAFLIEKRDLSLPKRTPASHKGNHGHVFIAAGVPEKEGAACLSAVAALRGGAGWTSLLGDETVLKLVRPRLIPEVMTTNFSELLLKKPGTGVVGPGYGSGPEKWKQFKTYLQSEWALILDADAFSLIAENEKEAIEMLSKRKAATVLTPHPKEASRLLNCSVEEVQKDRYLSSKRIADLFNAVCVLKGKGSVIALPDESAVYVVDRGTPVLAKGGSGDILAGLIGALLSQGLSAREATFTGVFIHGRAAELLTQKRGEDFTGLPSELTDFFSEAIAEL